MADHEKEEITLSESTLTAFVQLQTQIPPRPVTRPEDRGRVSFVFPATPEVKAAMRLFFTDHPVPIGSYVKIFRAVRAQIFALRAGADLAS
jgi:hypothetical protein